MAGQERKMEFRCYHIPAGTYVLLERGAGRDRKNETGAGRTLHLHNCLEIGYCYYGSGELVHSACLSGDEILRVAGRRGTLGSMKTHPVMGNLVLNILRECHEPDLYSTDSIKGYLYSLIFEVLRLDEERESARRTGPINRYIQSAVDYIGSRYSENIKIRELASKCGLSESHFRRIFVGSVGMKPAEYLNLVRIEHACMLIRKGERSMEDICYEVGYQTPSTFNRNFKKVTGRSPREFRDGS